MKKFNVTVCASGGGGNFQALIDSRNKIGFEINLLIVDRICGAIDRAAHEKIPVKHICTSLENFSSEFDSMIPEDTNLIVLAGFMPIVPEPICHKWNKRIINTHPSLLPKFGGKGMYGVKVQEAVLASRQETAGCTVHFVTPEIDAGEILLQKEIKVDFRESPWQLGARVFAEENKLLVSAVEILKNKYF